jgi:hypothetical protein
MALEMVLRCTSSHSMRSLTTSSTGAAGRLQQSLGHKRSLFYFLMFVACAVHNK